MCMKLIGIDGAVLGHWVIATCDGADRSPRVLEVTDNLADTFHQAASGQAIVVIDVPIRILSTSHLRPLWAVTRRV